MLGSASSGVPFAEPPVPPPIAARGATNYAIGGSDAAVPGVVSYTRVFIGLDYLLQ